MDALKIVVKAPNQEIGDQTVEGFLDWTVQRLKKHLSAVYPSKPNERNQRIIYSGKLLQDNLVLKDVLTVNEVRDKQTCTVHLVCTPSPDDLAKRETTARTSQSSESRIPSTDNRTPVLPNTDGLRQRTTQSQAATPHLQHQNMFPNASSMAQTSGPIPVPHGMNSNTAMSPEQLQWMQQMYTQQMLAYIQYTSMMAAGGAMTPGWNQGFQMASPWMQPTPQPAQPANQPHVAPVQPVPPLVNNNQPPPAPPAADNNVQRMNVGGGPAVDNDDEGMRRDWLDWTFTLCRFGILLSFVYFYSSVNRFLVVTGVVFLMYLYQAGFFQLRRRQRARPPIVPPQEPAARRQDTPDDDPANPTNDSNNDDTDSSTSATEDAEVPQEPPEPPRPGVLGTAWIFISTFFTSIIPQGPPQQFPAN